MKISNLPKERELAVIGKRYWSFAVGENACPAKYLQGGWNAFEFIVYKPYQIIDEGRTLGLSVRIAFAFWLPFHKL